MEWNLRAMATFGVAGNFTGHLEQAGEAADFVHVVTAEAQAPKAIFPTYLPQASAACPEFLNVFPFDSERIVYPQGQTKLQIEPECALILKATWDGDQITDLTPCAFGASNDCSIRREGAKKISLKKNWGASSKGFSAKPIALDSFTSESRIHEYRIASFLVRDAQVYAYGEDSAIRDYSYIYEKLTHWMIEKLNHQADEGPAEPIGAYLIGAGRPEYLLISIGATRYTAYGASNFLQNGDRSVVVLYPETAYTPEEIAQIVLHQDYDHADLSVLDQVVVDEPA